MTETVEVEIVTAVAVEATKVAATKTVVELEAMVVVEEQVAETVHQLVNVVLHNVSKKAADNNYVTDRYSAGKYTCTVFLLFRKL